MKGCVLKMAAMDATRLKKIINKFGGEKAVLGFQFDTNGKFIYTKDYKFNFSMIDEDIESVVYEEETNRGVKSIVVKDIERISAVIMAKQPDLFEYYDHRELFG